MLERWTRGVLRVRVIVLVGWVAVLVAGAYATWQLPDLLTNSFAVPATESDHARALLESRFGEQPEGTFVVVFDAPKHRQRLERDLALRLARAASLVPTGHAGELRAGAGVLYGEIRTSLTLARAKAFTDELRRSLRVGGAPRAYVTGQPAIQHDLDPVVEQDTRRAELVALPVALTILVAVFGFSLAVAIPLLFAACTIGGTFALLLAVAHVVGLPTYVTALVELVGLGLAIDYSLLVVHRFREELESGETTDGAVQRSLATAGRAVVASGLAVAISLAVLLLVPVPFVRGLGVAGLLVPLVAIGAALTLQPALLSLLGPSAVRRHRLHHRRAMGRDAGIENSEPGFWTRLATWVMRRRAVCLTAGVLVLLAACAPLASLRLTPGSLSSLPPKPEAMRGFARLAEGVAPGAVAPTQVVVAARRPIVGAGGTRAAINRLADALFHDPEVLVVASGSRPPYVDRSRDYARVIVVGRHEYGAPASRKLIARLRSRLVPDASFPAGADVSVGGVPAQGVDFVAQAYGDLLWIVLGVSAVTFLVLLRAFRSLLLPVKALLLNLLTVAAACGLLVVVFQWGVGRHVGLQRTAEIDAWVPLFVFAALFGLSMDYEVFLVSRMREAWDAGLDNAGAVAYGLERTGRVVTAAAAIMIVTFGSFAVGRIVGLQQLGLGLALGVLLDVTIVRMLVLPALMAVLGRYNWWLPPRVARLARVEPSAETH